MLHCLLLMGALYVSDGQVMVALSAVTTAERAGDLLRVGGAGGTLHLDVSAYPHDMAIHDILADCAGRADMAGPGIDLAAR